MIRQIVMYQILCNHSDCGSTASADIGFLDYNVAEAIAEDEGFQTIVSGVTTDRFPGTHYCPQHRRTDLPLHPEQAKA